MCVLTHQMAEVKLIDKKTKGKFAYSQSRTFEGVVVDIKHPGPGSLSVRFRSSSQDHSVCMVVGPL